MNSTATAREQLLDSALAWIDDHLDWFGPTTWEAHLPPLEIRTQTTVELLLLCRVLQHGPRCEQSQDLIDRARRLALDELEAEWFGEALEQADANFGYYVWLIGLLGEDTDPVVESRRTQAAAVLARYGTGLRPLEWPAINRIELDYILGLGGFDYPADGFAELGRESAYGDRSAELISEPETYAITHELLYAADLGLASLPLRGGPKPLAALLRTLLSAQLDAGQLDVSAELMHCLRLVADPATESIMETGWDRLLAGQLATGAVPGPPYDPQLADEPDADKREAMTFRTCYHTTVVAAMAAAAAELPEPAAAAELPETDRSRS